MIKISSGKPGRRPDDQYTHSFVMYNAQFSQPEVNIGTIAGGGNRQLVRDGAHAFGMYVVRAGSCRVGYG